MGLISTISLDFPARFRPTHAAVCRALLSVHAYRMLIGRATCNPMQSDGMPAIFTLSGSRVLRRHQRASDHLRAGTPSRAPPGVAGADGRRRYGSFDSIFDSILHAFSRGFTRFRALHVKMRQPFHLRACTEGQRCAYQACMATPDTRRITAALLVDFSAPCCCKSAHACPQGRVRALTQSSFYSF